MIIQETEKGLRPLRIIIESYFQMSWEKKECNFLTIIVRPHEI